METRFPWSYYANRQTHVLVTRIGTYFVIPWKGDWMWRLVGVKYTRLGGAEGITEEALAIQAAEQDYIYRTTEFGEELKDA